MTIVNDIHSQLNPTQVRRVVRPTSVEDVRAAILDARTEGCAVSVAGGRHAMGGQQFGADTVLLDMRGLNRVLDLDGETAPGGETTRPLGDAGPKRRDNSCDHPLIHTREPCLTKPTD